MSSREKNSEPPTEVDDEKASKRVENYQESVNYANESEGN